MVPNVVLESMSVLAAKLSTWVDSLAKSVIERRETFTLCRAVGEGGEQHPDARSRIVLLADTVDRPNMQYVWATQVVGAT